MSNRTLFWVVVGMAILFYIVMPKNLCFYLVNGSLCAVSVAVAKLLYDPDQDNFPDND